MPMTGKTRPASSANSSNESSVTCPTAAPTETDALVIGAGPVGLFQVFELGLLEIGAHVVDSLPYAGGQCTALYADKAIYDIPGLPRCTGRELIERLQRQIAPFEAPLHLGQEVRTVQAQADGRFLIESSAGTRWLARAVIVAGGVGSFQPRRLKIDGVAAFEGAQLRYHADGDVAGRQVVIIGDGDGALEQAIRLTAPGPQQAATVTLMHRRDEFKAAPATLAAVQALRASGRLHFVAAQATGITTSTTQGANHLTGLVVQQPDGARRTLALDVLFVLTGLAPKLGPIAEWGLALERKQVVVDTATFETGTPGLFAVGDVNTYPGKKKLILSGFHEAALAAYGVAARLRPGTPEPLEYTTSSTRLHRLLKVDPEAGP